ncbi:MAG: AI-2E family transporter [Lachnospiraceae bacterium]|nr:AI-2E family transporter [Lachnospiraceae bacterium]
MQSDRQKYFFWLKILLTIAALTLGVLYFEQVCLFVKEGFGILSPFLVGALIAFILNIPMRGIEKVCFGKAKGKFWLKIKRPVSIILSIVFLCGLLTLLIFAVVPQVVETAKTMPDKISAFWYSTLEWLESLIAKYPKETEMIMDEVKKMSEMEIDWKQLLTQVKDFFFTGFGGSFIKNVFSFTGKIGGGIFNAVIALIFSIYILAQKEKLCMQGKRIMSAFMSEKVYRKTAKILSMLMTNFSNFIAGQCIEAVILALLTMIAMAIFRFDYILLVGVLVAFTALIPVVGGFIGCGIGAFLFLMDDPIKALWFVVLFLVVQQIEGNLIYPYVVGNSVGLPSMWILAAITIGGSVMGIGGMLFFIPLFSTAYMLLRDTVNERNGEKPWTEKALKEKIRAHADEEEGGRRGFGIFKFKRNRANNATAPQNESSQQSGNSDGEENVAQENVSEQSGSDSTEEE